MLLMMHCKINASNSNIESTYFSLIINGYMKWASINLIHLGLTYLDDHIPEFNSFVQNIRIREKIQKNQPKLLHLGSQLSKKLTSLGRNLFGFIFVSNCFSK